MSRQTSHTAAPRRELVRPFTPRGSGSACESDGDDSDGQGAPQGGGGVQSTPVSARAAEILRVLRSVVYRGHFHEKIGASFYNPNRQNPAVSCLMFLLACVYGARGRHHTAQMESWTTASVECVETCAFFPFSEAKKIQNRPKMGFEPIFSPHRGSILSRRAWRVAPAAA